MTGNAPSVKASHDNDEPVFEIDHAAPYSRHIGLTKPVEDPPADINKQLSEFS